ncbi:MAG: hypothetical protein COX29_02445 [Candidatus Moranbacteria bacterium CG23_combo_of_CG06-09_8_20_14_all_35_22]|nr:MAG: hypothetical protein COX29_02445 [Candidatus Moranbacteria bacterium CG23_combo_of_CG06-09_8_20_14_all_35_22]
MDNLEKKMKTKKEKDYVEKDLQAVVAFLDGLSNKIIERTRNVDSQCNVIIGLSTGIFILAINEVMNSDHLHITLSLIAFFSALSAIISLLAIRPPSFMVKKGQEESLLYSKKIADFESAREYSIELKKILKKDQDIFQHFSIEIYNLSKYYYRPKRKLFEISRNIFLFGVIFSLIILFLEVKFL